VLTALLLFLGGLGAGVFGSLLGLGGGILLVPLLTVGFGYSIVSAVGTSLVCVVATSAGAASRYVRTGQADVRLGITLEVATATGALAGGFVAGIIPERLLAGFFALLLLYTAYTLGRRALAPTPAGTAPEARSWARAGEEAPAYRTTRLPAAMAGSLGAGVISALLGIGGGIVKVPIVHLVMGAPMHVSVATSNFIIGVTAATGAYVYLFRGEISPAVAGPVVLGVALGAAAGARISGRVSGRWLSFVFLAVLLFTAFQMAQRALGAA
jgi:uncharacterized membrane protein YfcA